MPNRRPSACRHHPGIYLVGYAPIRKCVVPGPSLADAASSSHLTFWRNCIVLESARLGWFVVSFHLPLEPFEHGLCSKFFERWTTIKLLLPMSRTSCPHAANAASWRISHPIFPSCCATVATTSATSPARGMCRS